MTTSHSDDKWTKNTITKIANKTSRTYLSYYVDEDDLVQAGWIGFLKAAKIHGYIDSSLRPYVFTAIARNIKKAGLESTGILQAPHRIKKIIVQICTRLKDGENIRLILSDLGISNDKWKVIQILLKQYTLVKKSKCPIVDIHSDFSFILKDILDIPTLTDIEKRIILARINNNQESLNMSRTTIWKYLQTIRSKLARGSYVA